MSYSGSLTAQQDIYWQQEANYRMEIDFDVKTHRYEGKQWIEYTNNSPDTIYRVFYHLYFNAFQPGSMMDVRSRSLPDPDPRVRDRISKLKPDEIGYQRIVSFKSNGNELPVFTEETIAEIGLKEALAPGETREFYLGFEAQVPLQIRRSGRDNREGIDYSMTQWYPKLCAYDEDGWHPNPYVGREFYGNWGSFDVKISIDKKYILGGTGVLQNAEELGYGYSDARKKPKGRTATWHFKADRVHDFAWAADPEYQHIVHQVPDGPVLHLLYDKSVENPEYWELLPYKLDTVWRYIEDNFGPYPYSQYSILQGGDGGMEYPMATLITGNRPMGSLIGVTVHELMHSWYQGVLGTNEARYAWMDEGFTSYASARIMKQINDPGSDRNPFAGTYIGYRKFAETGTEEALSIHADHFLTNRAYGVGSYVKGAIFLHQLGYIVGQDVLNRILLRYYNDWKFKHPNDDDFVRIAEEESGMVLDWYQEHWIYSTRVIDYAIDTVYNTEVGVTVELANRGTMPMPLDILVRYSSGDEIVYNIPLRMMRGSKQNDYPGKMFDTMSDWPWVYSQYSLSLPGQLEEIESITIDPESRMADIDPENGQWPVQEEAEGNK